MTDIVKRLQEAMHEESALYAPQTTKAIETMREAKTVIERLKAALTQIIHVSDDEATVVGTARAALEPKP